MVEIDPYMALLPLCQSRGSFMAPWLVPANGGATNAPRQDLGTDMLSSLRYTPLPPQGVKNIVERSQGGHVSFVIQYVQECREEIIIPNRLAVRHRAGS